MSKKSYHRFVFRVSERPQKYILLRVPFFKGGEIYECFYLEEVSDKDDNEVQFGQNCHYTLKEIEKSLEDKVWIESSPFNGLERAVFHAKNIS